VTFRWHLAVCNMSSVLARRYIVTDTAVKFVYESHPVKVTGARKGETHQSPQYKTSTVL